MSASSPILTGLSGAIGCDYRLATNDLLFVEYAGKLSRLNLSRRLQRLVSRGTATLQGTWSFDFEAGAQVSAGTTGDVFWRQHTATVRSMDPINGAKIVNLGVTDFSAVTYVSLQGYAYGTAPIPANNDATNKLVDGDVFAVLTREGHFAKVRVLHYGYNIDIEWETYELTPAYEVLGTGYHEPEDVKAGAGSRAAFVTERSGNLLLVDTLNANRAAAQVIASGLTAPHQIALDLAHNHAYVVEYAAAGRLLRVDITTGALTVVASNLEHAVGLVITSDLASAYVSEQATGGASGRLVRIALNTGARTVVATGLTSPFFLEWTDASERAILVAERDPANRLAIVDLASSPATVTRVSAPLGTRPSSTALVSPSRVLVCANDEIDDVALSATSVFTSGVMFLGIGHVPYDRISDTTGLADTTVDPSYSIFQVKDAPFGGKLPIMFNHQDAYLAGARYFRVVLAGNVRRDTFSDYKRSRSTGLNTLATVSDTTVGGLPGCYPVHPPEDLFLWMHPSLGAIVDTAGLADGAMHAIQIQLVSAAGAVLSVTPAKRVLVENRRCTATIALPTLGAGGPSASPVCGTMNYGTSTTTPVVMAFTASHPGNRATWSFSLLKGVNGVALPSPTSGSLQSPPGPLPPASISAPVAELLGKCKIAGFAESIQVATMAVDGWRRLSEYDAAAAIAFVLAP